MLEWTVELLPQRSGTSARHRADGLQLLVRFRRQHAGAGGRDHCGEWVDLQRRLERETHLHAWMERRKRRPGSVPERHPWVVHFHQRQLRLCHRQGYMGGEPYHASKLVLSVKRACVFPGRQRLSVAVGDPHGIVAACDRPVRVRRDVLRAARSSALASRDPFRAALSSPMWNAIAKTAVNLQGAKTARNVGSDQLKLRATDGHLTEPTPENRAPSRDWRRRRTPPRLLPSPG